MATELSGFSDRAEAGFLLAAAFRGRRLRHPLVLAIPRGGVVTGAPLARGLGADLDVVLSRKLRAPHQPEYAIGAIAEDGWVTVNADAWGVPGMSERYLEAEKQYQLGEIARRTGLIRAVRPAAPVAGRSVVVVDDGIATGATMIAALQWVRARGPHELIAAAPVAAPDRLAEVRRWCDDAVCLLARNDFGAIGYYYDHFEPVGDDEVVRLLRAAAPAAGPADGVGT